MEVVTRCSKRGNEVNIILSSRNKKIVECLYYSPRKQLIKKMDYYGKSIEEARAIYLERLKWHREIGYEIKDKKEGKIIFLQNLS